jgi:2-methylcitrate dehydratase PrpD
MWVVPTADLYRLAFIDWLACACRGAREPAAQAVRETGDDLLADVAFAGTAGHVLDYDDTFPDGVAHVSATSAPAALLTAAHHNLTVGQALEAYAEGFEATAAVAQASHPALYDRGWHPTAVCGPIGAAVAAGRLLKLSDAQLENAVAVAVLRAGGARGAFGSDGKAIQVGLAAAAGVQAALMAKAGARVDPQAIHGPVGFTAVLGATWSSRTGKAIERNWIKLHPSCLGTHSPIEAATQVRDADELTVHVHPVARQAAHIDVPHDGLAAKFSIQYCVAHTLSKRPPGVSDFDDVDPDVMRRAAGIEVAVDPQLPEFGAVLTSASSELVRVLAPVGSPDRPATRDQLQAKIRDLIGEDLQGLLSDESRPAAEVAALLSRDVVAPGAPSHSHRDR